MPTGFKMHFKPLHNFFKRQRFAHYCGYGLNQLIALSKSNGIVGGKKVNKLTNTINTQEILNPLIKIPIVFLILISLNE